MRIPRLLPLLLISAALSAAPENQFSQQGGKLVGGTPGSRGQGLAVALSADGNTAIVGAPSFTGGAWVFTRKNGVWTQQGPQLIGTDGSVASQGSGVGLSADGNTAVIGGDTDNGSVGAAWIFVRVNGVWSQQGNKLVGSGAVGQSRQGHAVGISADANTVAVGGYGDNNRTGAIWIFTRTQGVWSQQGSKLLGTAEVGMGQLGGSLAISGAGDTVVAAADGDDNKGATFIFARTAGVWTQQGAKLVGASARVGVSGDGLTAITGPNFATSLTIYVRNAAPQGAPWVSQVNNLSLPGAAGPGPINVALSGNGNIAVAGSPADTNNAGAIWILRRANGVWTASDKVSGTGAVGAAQQGTSVAISSDGSTVIEGGYQDSAGTGAAWPFAVPNAGATPLPVSVTPNAGSGLSTSFTFTFTDTAGWQNLTVVNALIYPVLDGRHACYLAFAASGAGSGTVYLVNDDGDSGGPYSVTVLPGTGTAANSQCSIAAAGSSVSGSGNTLTLTLAVTFTASFAGNKVMYLAAGDTFTNSGWHPLGTWNVPGAPGSGPAVSGMSPGRATTAAATYTFNFTDTNGWQDLSVLNVLINNAIDGRQACYVAFLPTGANAGSVLLVNDLGDAGGPYAVLPLPGSAPASVANSQCSIAAEGSSVSAAGNGLTLILKITFSPAFSGDRVAYLAARSNTANSGWQSVGTIAVPQ